MNPDTNKPRKHFSMVRGMHLADLFTLANAACGVGGVFCAMVYVGSQSVAHFLAAAALAPAAFIFDVLDGRIARWRHTHSALGRELDSLVRRDFFWRRPGGPGICRRHARRLGLGGADLFRLLRREPARPLQRDRRAAFRRRAAR